MFTQESTDLFDTLRTNPDKTNWKNDEDRFIRSVVLPFKDCIDKIRPFIYEWEPNFCANQKEIKRTKSAPFLSVYDSVTAFFKRDKNGYPFYPFLKIIITPYQFCIQLGCLPFCTELMDIIRLMAMDGDEKFNKAWEIMNNNKNIHLVGKRFKVETRFYYYPDEKIRHFLSFRDLHICMYQDLKCIVSDDFPKYLIDQLQLIMPIYEFLLSASSSMGKYDCDPQKLTKWSIHPREYWKLNQE